MAGMLKKIEGYHVVALTEDGMLKVVAATTKIEEAAKKADDLRAQGYIGVDIIRYK